MVKKGVGPLCNTILIYSFIISLYTKYHPRFPGDDKQTIVRHHNTIGAFYNHIMNALGNLTDCGRNNSIFTGDPNKQVDFNHSSVHGHSLKVDDYKTAVKAIQNIVEQGEGSSPCNPLAWNTGNKKDLSHYFLFYSVAEKREIQVVNKSVSPPDQSTDDGDVVDFTKVFCKERFASVYTLHKLRGVVFAELGD